MLRIFHNADEVTYNRIKNARRNHKFTSETYEYRKELLREGIINVILIYIS